MMKKLIKILMISVVLFLITPEETFAQGPPPWAPAHGYRAKTKYIYFPERNFYYDLNQHNYIYLSGSNWTFSATLPKLFIGINLGSTRQVELDYYGSRPYQYNSTHIVRYKGKASKPKSIKVKEVIKHNEKQGKSHGKKH